MNVQLVLEFQVSVLPTPETSEPSYDDRFSVAPAIAVAGSAKALALAAGVAERTVHRWAHEGVRWARANELAVALGHHPGELWPEWWAVAS